jgi:YgiT-type zinc finger domain-containing protein
MQCSVCGRNQTRPGKATITLEHGGTTLVVRGVPAEVCPACGEQYVDDRIALRLLKSAEAAARSGVRSETRDYAVA